MRIVRKKFKRKALSVACSMALCAYAAAEPVTYSGSINAVNPEVTIESTSRPVANVKDFYLEVQKDAQECDILTDRWEADNTFLDGAKPLCLFEWTGEINGVVQDGRALKGVLTQSDEVSFGYQVSIINDGEQHVILSDTYTINVESPVAPVILDVIANWSDGVKRGVDQENFDKERRLNGLTVEVEPRPFTQLFRFGEETCLIDIDQGSCEISGDFGIPGDGVPEAVGAMVESVEVLDMKEYLIPEMEVFSVDYDYRSPEVIDFVVNGVGNTETINYDLDEHTFELEPNEALLVLRTPHSSRNGDWWKPNVTNIHLTPDDDVQSTQTLEVLDTEIEFPVVTTVPNQKYTIRESGSWEQYGDYFVMRYSVENLPDSEYTASINVSDALDNSREDTAANKLLDRNGSPIIALLGDNELRSDSSVELYFPEEVIFASYAGWDDGTTITSITRDGQPAPHTMITDKVARLDEDPSISKGDILEYEVTSIDGSGNENTETFSFLYNPSEFAIYGKTDEVYQSVQSLDLKLYQTDGSSCTLAATPDAATEFSYATRKGCVVEFTSIPDGVTGGILGRNVSITGAIGETGPHNIDYSVRYYNDDGSNKVVFEGQKTIYVEEVPPLDMSLSSINRIADGVYSVPYDASVITRLNYEYANSDVVFTVSNGDAQEISEFRGTSKFMMRSGRMTVERLSDGGTDLWKKSAYTITGNYGNLEGMGSELSFDVVVTPHSRTEAFLELNAIEDVTSSDMIEVKMNVGFYDHREQTYSYDAESMGDWVLQMYADTDDSPIALTDEIAIDEDGSVQLNMDAQVFFDSADSFYVVAKSKADIDGFDMELRSRNVRLDVLKGSAVEGSLREKVISEEIPFRGILTFDYDTVDDRVVKGSSAWEMSTDGVNWTEIPDSEAERVFFTKEDPTETLYRYRTVNKYTGVVGYSEVARVIGFEKQEFEIEGPRKLLANQVGTFSVSETGSLVGPAGGVYEYSVDNKQTWTEFAGSFEHSADDNFSIYVRNKLDTAASEFVGDEAYEEARWIVRVEDAEKVRVSLTAPRSAEVDFPVTLESRSRYPDYLVEAPIINEFTLPDGSVVQGETVEYIIKESDVVDDTTEFTLRSWVKGYKEETISEETEIIPTLKYDFPDTQLYSSRYYALAPTEIRLTALMDRVYVDDVEFDFEWIYDTDKFELVKDYGERIILNATSSGLHEVELKVSDNRGNERLFSELLTVEEAPPSEVELMGYLSKRNMRVPISVIARAKIDLSHYKDTVTDIEWFVNGEKIEAIGTYQTLDFSDAGENEVTVRVNTEFGQVAEDTLTYDLLPNLPPTCSPVVEDEDTHYNVVHNCTDSDGKIAKVSYYYEIGSNEYVSSELRFNKSTFPNATVEIIAVDDGGEESTYSVSW